MSSRQGSVDLHVNEPYFNAYHENIVVDAVTARPVAVNVARMRIHRPGLLEAFWINRFADSEKALRAWFYEARNASWNTPTELKAQFRNASILKAGRAVFNICGNKYRLVVRIDYRAQIALIRWIGTHSEYDGIDAEDV